MINQQRDIRKARKLPTREIKQMLAKIRDVESSFGIGRKIHEIKDILVRELERRK